ncbi:sensor histidine kinase [Streptomyces scabiei]|nr:sensor histidine kinase [Streptomyces scabiei]MDX2539009.1 sensor histidine kinase [Streptomyces scabiei]MDX2801182.1 sensor histidine kinase [Streptomyces scabiei]MDX3217049.1 sensor histidine kinase [Streptomyces scabiei]MDX3829652.1 sensor histidine kinase [Streptomyces scabiei]
MPRGGGRPASDDPGPPASGLTLVPWLLMGLGAYANILQGHAPNPWIGGLGIFTFNSLYIYVVIRAFVPEKRDSPSTRASLVALGLIAGALALAYGGDWLNFLPLLGLAVGAATRGPLLRRSGLTVTVLAGGVAAVREGWGAVGIAYGTFLSVVVTAAILSLVEAVRELRAAREELAHRAVERERLRFSRDLHDLLGHTLSVIVVKSEAARRLAPHDMNATLAQIEDIETVGRQALTEIREAVTGYREGSLTTELDHARSVLSAAGTTLTVRRSGPPPGPQAEALLGWVVREAITNVVRHSHATTCEIALATTDARIHLTVTDKGPLPPPPPPPPATSTTPNGLRGLTERLAAAGGTLRAGPAPCGGFEVSAELPVTAPPVTPREACDATSAWAAPGAERERHP